MNILEAFEAESGIKIGKGINQLLIMLSAKTRTD